MGKADESRAAQAVFLSEFARRFRRVEASIGS